MSTRRPLIVLFGLLAFAGLVIGAALSPYSGRWLRGFSGIPGIEDRIEDDARAMLAGLDIDDADVSADGRNLSVATASQLPGSLQNDLAGIDGVGSVRFTSTGDDGAALDTGADGSGEDDGDAGDGAAGAGGADDPDAAAAPARELQIAYDGDAVVLSGSVQSAEGRDALVRSAQRLVGESNVTDGIEVVEGDRDDFTEVSTVASVLRRLDEWYDDADVRLDGDELRVTGSPAEGSDIDQAGQVVAQLAQRAGLDARIDHPPVEADAGDGADGDDDRADADADADDEAGDGAADGVAGAEGASTDGADGEAMADILAGFDFGPIEFEPGTAIFTAEAVVSLDDIATQLTGLPRVPISVIGHTSDDGDPDVNLLLSDDRARAVREYLIGKGVPAAQLDARGVGGSQPVVDNSTDEGRATNERIELVVAEGN